MKHLVSVHSGGGSMSEAADPEWLTLLDDATAAKALCDDLNAAIRRDPNRPDAWAQVTSVEDTSTVPAGLTGDALWAWVKPQTCCLNDE